VIRIYVAVGVLALRLQLAKRRHRRAYTGRHWSTSLAIA
jgi:hypothetical protein